MRMKQIMMLVVTAGLLCSCGEREQAAAKVTYDKAVDALVEQVGKADVALELYKKELRRRRENWIKMKQLSISYERRAKEAAEAVGVGSVTHAPGISIPRNLLALWDRMF